MKAAPISSLAKSVNGIVYPFGHRVEDRCFGVIGFPNEVEGVIESDVNSTYQLGANVYGTEGMLEVNENRLRYMTKSGWHDFQPTDTEQRPYGNAHVDQAYGIVEWIEGKNENYLGQAKQGKAALEIMLAVYESARMHEHVNLPLLTRANPLDVAVESGVLPVERPGMYDERSFLVRGEAMSWSPKK